MTEATAKAASGLPRSIAGLGQFRGVLMLLFATGVGIGSGVVVTAISWITQELHVVLFGLAADERLSAQVALASPLLATLPMIGGVLMGLSIVLSRRFRTRPPVDPIEANAVHGGRMSFRESLIVTVQTVISSSFGASVGLEAGYTQINAALASRLATFLNLRRNEIRTLVGCGAAAAIAAAFNAPLTGAFYGFELIIGAYSPSLLAPVVLASLAASLTASRLGAVQMSIEFGQIVTPTFTGVLPFLVLGLIGGVAAIAIMRLVTLVEAVFSWTRCPPPFRPIIGGAAVGALALITPQVLSSGHGALHLQLTQQIGLAMIAALFVLKVIASIVSLGSGFRGGLFFASLFLGALLGKLYAGILGLIGLAPGLDPVLAAVVGMAALAVGVVGGPLTMTFLVLEITGDLTISVAVLAASVVSSFLVRETFGYSFSTWRLHLRGESIRSAHDVGRMRSLIVRAMMRQGVKTVPESILLDDFCERYPLGSTERAIVLDRSGRYAGIVLVAEAHLARAENVEAEPGTIEPLLKYRDKILLPSMNAKDAAVLFDQANSEELAVVDHPESRRVVGLLTEAYLLRRYAEELDKGWQDLTGETSR
jgi:CIC family chloride channel protein